jgi:hypothetical protein
MVGAKRLGECGSPLPLLEGITVSSGFQSARGLAQSKTLRILVLLCLQAVGQLLTSC